jgi:hypothetical protein
MATGDGILSQVQVKVRRKSRTRFYERILGAAKLSVGDCMVNRLAVGLCFEFRFYVIEDNADDIAGKW